MRRLLLTSISTLTLLASGVACQEIAGLSDFGPEPTGQGGGGASSGGSGGGSGGDGGNGGSAGAPCVLEVGEDWLATVGGDEEQRVNAVAVGACNGHVVVAGDTDASFQVPPGTPVGAGDQDMFLALFDAHGVPLFVKSFGTTATSALVRANGVAIDHNGNVVVVGAFSGTQDFGGEQVDSATDNTDGFVISYSAAGAFRWQVTFGGALRDSAEAVTIDPVDGSIWVTGSHGPGAEFFDETPPAVDEDVFVLRMTPGGAQPAEGQFLWSLTGAGTQVGLALQVDADRFYVAGEFPTTIDPEQGEPVTGAAGDDVFIAAYDKGGPYRWLKTIMGNEDDVEPQLALPSGMVVASANVTASATATGCSPETSIASVDMVVAGFSRNDGECLWSNLFGGNGQDHLRGMAVDGNGAVVLTGRMTGSLDVPFLEAVDTSDIFVIELDDLGAPTASRRLDANGVGSDDVYGIAFGPYGERALGGRFQSTIVQGDDNAESQDGNDGFLMYTNPSSVWMSGTAGSAEVGGPCPR